MYKLATLLVSMLLTASCLGQNREISISFLDIILHPISTPVYDFSSELSSENQITINDSLFDAYIRQHIENIESCKDCIDGKLALGTGMIRVIYFESNCVYHTLYIDRIYTETLHFGESMILDGKVIEYDKELGWVISSVVNYMETKNTRCADSIKVAVNHILRGRRYEYFPLLPPPPAK